MRLGAWLAPPSSDAGVSLVLFLSRMLVAQAWGAEARAPGPGFQSLTDRPDGLGTTSLLTAQPGPLAAGNRTEMTPRCKAFWAIAHRVLVAQGVRDALDWCDGARPTCNIEALQELARTILQPAGVKVLYGFYSPGGRAFPLVWDSLNDNETINLDGRACDVQAAFEAGGGPGNVTKRVLSYGCFALAFQFGSSCSGQARRTCTQLRQGSASGAFDKVFGWTVSKGRRDEAEQLMEAGVDGLIYGFMLTSYYDSANMRATLVLLTGWLSKNPNKRYLARTSDAPW